ncbi:hypothetical protein BN2156_01946 [Mycolicibacterium neworleansense]|uniref:Uncharacterized protein n=1 Tax=Mycolicibacterium neworleansense TaxID=146018 RepID=A0A0H5RM44_9MYCO|nr:hypothetical protein BN2156_01946 [Mycolicibacterium neworleansense]
MLAHRAPAPGPVRINVPGVKVGGIGADLLPGVPTRC